MEKHKNYQKKYGNPDTVEKRIRKTLSHLLKLVPELTLPVDLETEIIKPLGRADFNTRRQAFLLWEIQNAFLEQMTSIFLKVAALYCAEHCEDDVLDYWGSAMDRMLTDIYLVFYQPSTESFLDRYRLRTRSAHYGTP